MKVWIFNNRAFSTQEKAEKESRNTLIEGLTNYAEKIIEKNRKFAQNEKNYIEVINRLLETDFPTLLDKFVAREDIDNVCDAIEKIIKEINPEFYIRKPIPEEEMYEYEWEDDYVIHMFPIARYSKVNDIDDDLERLKRDLAEYNSKIKEGQEYIEKLENLSLDELIEKWKLNIGYSDYLIITESEVY